MFILPVMAYWDLIDWILKKKEQKILVSTGATGQLVYVYSATTLL